MYLMAAAPITLSTVDQGVRRDHVPNLETLDARADFDHRTRKFVSQNHGRHAPGEWVGLIDRDVERTVEVLFQVSAADTAPSYLNLDLAPGWRRRVGKFLNADVSSPVPNGCFH